MRITPERLDEIEQRANAATAGPWLDHHGEFVSQAGSYMAICRVNRPVTVSNDFRVTIGGPPGCETSNKQFIAHARTDVPDLIADLREARARIAELEAIVNQRREVRAGASDDSIAGDF